MSTFMGLEIGERLGGNSKLRTHVYLATQPTTNKKFVLKMIPIGDHPVCKALYDKEVVALRKLNSSEYIVNLIEQRKARKSDSVFGCLVLEYVDGKTLSSAID